MELIIKNRKIANVFLAVITAAFWSSCQKGDGDADYGFAYVYIPQATFTSLDNTYPVPSGAGKNTYNFKVDTLSDGTPDKINIILGVLRSGKISDAEGFTVNVNVLSEMTNDAIIALDDALPLPASMFTIPDKAVVEAGTNSALFYVTVDVNQLTNSMYIGKKLVLAVGISEPTNNFELAKDNTSVVIIIDVDAMLTILF